MKTTTRDDVPLREVASFLIARIFESEHEAQVASKRWNVSTVDYMHRNGTAPEGFGALMEQARTTHQDRERWRDTVFALIARDAKSREMPMDSHPLREWSTTFSSFEPVSYAHECEVGCHIEDHHGILGALLAEPTASDELLRAASTYSDHPEFKDRWRRS